MNKFNSEKYWIDRYRLRQGNSGAGSYGIYAEYKAKIINDFFIQNNITTVLELGCGDGNQLSLLKPKKYYGYDVSLLVVENNKLRFPNFIFSTNIADFLLMKYDVTMSLDVIYHLIEDDIYYLHMKHLFELSGKYVIIYSPNRFEKLSGEHNMFREFMVDIPENFELIQKIDNPLKGAYTQSDFYIFEKL